MKAQRLISNCGMSRNVPERESSVQKQRSTHRTADSEINWRLKNCYLLESFCFWLRWGAKIGHLADLSKKEKND